MSMHAACRVLAESRASLKQEEITQGMCKEWIWEFILRHCCDSRLLRAMALAYPVPESRHLKRLLLLRALSFDILERCFTDRTFETMSALYSLYCSEGHRNCYQVTRTDSAGKSYRHRFELWMLCLAVRLECTVQYLRPESDDWPKFYESVEKYWGDLAQDTEEPEFKDDSYNLDNGSYSQLKDKLWAVLKQPELRHDLLRQHKREDVIEMMESFVSAAWEDVRVTFLESVAHSIEKGLYVSDGLPQKSDCRTKGVLLQIADISPGKSFHARKQKEEIQNSAFVLETGSPDPRKSIPMPHGSLLHQDTGDLSAPKHGHDRQPGSSVGSTSKEVGKDLPSSGGHTFQSMTNISDGGIFVRSAIKLDNESTVSLHSRRREMPASLLEGKTGLMLPNSSTNNL